MRKMEHKTGIIPRVMKDEPIADPRESRDLKKMIFAAQRGGFHYVVDEGSYYQITDRPFDRKIVWTDPTCNG